MWQCDNGENALLWTVLLCHVILRVHSKFPALFKSRFYRHFDPGIELGHCPWLLHFLRSGKLDVVATLHTSPVVNVTVKKKKISPVAIQPVSLHGRKPDDILKSYTSKTFMSTNLKKKQLYPSLTALYELKQVRFSTILSQYRHHWFEHHLYIRCLSAPFRCLLNYLLAPFWYRQASR